MREKILLPSFLFKEGSVKGGRLEEGRKRERERGMEEKRRREQGGGRGKWRVCLVLNSLPLISSSCRET